MKNRSLSSCIYRAAYDLEYVSKAFRPMLGTGHTLHRGCSCELCTAPVTLRLRRSSISLPLVS